MAVGIQAKVDLQQFRSKMRKFKTKIKPRQLLEAVGNRVIKWTKDNLEQAGLDKKHERMAVSTVIARPKRTSMFHFSSRWRGSSGLGGSFTKTITGNQVFVGTEDEFAAIHHFGTKPKTFGPRRKPFLVFQTADGWVRTKQVNHPGIPARPLLPKNATAEKLAVGVISATLDRAAREASG